MIWEITQADRAGWQRRAARELAAILDGCGGLPPIAWTVGPSGGVPGRRWMTSSRPPSAAAPGCASVPGGAGSASP